MSGGLTPGSQAGARHWLRVIGASLLAMAATATAAQTGAAATKGGPSAGAPPSTSAPRFDGAVQRDGRYVNLNPFALPTAGDMVDWYWNWLLAGGTKPPPGGYESVPVDATDVGYLRANRRDTTVTWLGHATVLVQLGGLNVLTDPQFSERASPFSFVGPARKVRLPFAIADAPHVDVVLISHNHYDHLDADSVDALSRQAGGPPLFVVPLGVDRWFRARGIERVVALDWWEARDVEQGSSTASSPPSAWSDRLRFTLVPAQHWSARSPTDRFETLWGGYVVERVRRTPRDAVDYRVFFGGDTGYGRAFREMIHARFDRFDFAAIPIGAYEPNRYLHAQHVTPQEAVQIHRDLAVRQSLGIHWGTFVLTAEPFDQPPKDLAMARTRAGVADDAFVTFRHGETRILEKDATR